MLQTTLLITYTSSEVRCCNPSKPMTALCIMTMTLPPPLSCFTFLGEPPRESIVSEDNDKLIMFHLQCFTRCLMLSGFHLPSSWRMFHSPTCQTERISTQNNHFSTFRFSIHIYHNIYVCRTRKKKSLYVIARIFFKIKVDG